MANIYNDLITYIAAQLGGSWAVGTNLFYPRFPQNSSTGIAVRSAGSAANNRYVEQRNPYITITSRAADIDTALTNWQLVYALFSKNENIALTNYHIMFSLALNGDPILITDGPRYWEWEGSFSLRYRPN